MPGLYPSPTPWLQMHIGIRIQPLSLVICALFACHFHFLIPISGFRFQILLIIRCVCRLWESHDCRCPQFTCWWIDNLLTQVKEFITGWTKNIYLRLDIIHPSLLLPWCGVSGQPLRGFWGHNIRLLPMWVGRIAMQWLPCNDHALTVHKGELGDKL